MKAIEENEIAIICIECSRVIREGRLITHGLCTPCRARAREEEEGSGQNREMGNGQWATEVAAEMAHCLVWAEDHCWACDTFVGPYEDGDRCPACGRDLVPF